MVAAFHHQLDSYNQLLRSHGADPELTDYSGKKADHFLEMTKEGPGLKEEKPNYSSPNYLNPNSPVEQKIQYFDQAQ